MEVVVDGEDERGDGGHWRSGWLLSTPAVFVDHDHVLSFARKMFSPGGNCKSRCKNPQAAR